MNCQKLCGIYIIISPTARVYIGQAVDIERRKASYKRGNGIQGQTRVYHSINKYGFDAHLFEIIELCDESKLNERERFWQDEYEVLGEYGMNCKLTKTTDKSGRASEETRKRNSEAQKGKKISDELKQKLFNANKGRIPTEQQKKLQSDKMKGRKLSEETKQKMRKARKLYLKQKQLNKNK